MALENSLGSTTSLALGATNPLVSDNVLWPLILEGLKPQGTDDEKPDKRKADDKNRAPVELFLHIVGGKQSGKSTLLRQLLDLKEEASSQAALTEMVEYHCRKYGESKSEELPSYLRTGDVLNCWEYSSDDDVRDAITKPSINSTFIRGLSQMKRAVVIICVDMSKPSEVLPTLEFWVRRVREKCTFVIEGAMGTKNEKIAQQLLDRARDNFSQRPAKGDATDRAQRQLHEDTHLIAHTGVGVIIVATRCATFEREFEPELRKVMVNALRCIAHNNGASLFGLGGLDGSRSNPTAEVRELRAYIEKLLTQGPKLKTNNAMKLNKEITGSLSIPAGEDSFASIGLPRGMDGIPPEELEVAWRALAEKYFPAAAKAKRDPRMDWEREHAAFSVELGMNMLLSRLQEADRAKREKQAKERPPSTSRTRASRPTSSSQQQASSPGPAVPPAQPPPPAPGGPAPPPRPRSSATTPRAATSKRSASNDLNN